MKCFRLRQINLRCIRPLESFLNWKISVATVTLKARLSIYRYLSFGRGWNLRVVYYLNAMHSCNVRKSCGDISRLAASFQEMRFRF